MSDTAYQYAYFAFILAALLAAIEIDFGRAFRRKFMGFRPNEILSARWIYVFADPLKLGKRARLNLWSRYFFWHFIVAGILLVVGFVAVNIKPVGAAIDALLPHFFQLAKDSDALLKDAEIAQIATMALLLFLVIRLPGEFPDEPREQLAITGFRKILVSFSIWRDTYILDYVLKGKEGKCRVDVRKDIVKHRICSRKLTRATRKKLFDNLLNECVQPTSAKEHQILMGYIDMKGAIALDARLNTSEEDIRQEIRRPTSFEVELKNVGSGETFTAHVRNVGIAPEQSLTSLGFNHESTEDMPVGEYKLCRVDEEEQKNGVGLDVKARPNSEEDSTEIKFALVRPSSAELGRMYVQHVLIHN